MEKVNLLAAYIDLLLDRVDSLGQQRPLDEQVEVFELEQLAEDYGTTTETMGKQIAAVLGDSAVIKVGKKRVIRKSKFLEFLETKEAGMAQ